MAALYYGNQMHTGNSNAAKGVDLIDDIALIGNLKLNALAKKKGLYKRAAISFSQAAIGTIGAGTVLLGMRMAAPGRVARTYINDANVKARRAVQEMTPDDPVTPSITKPKSLRVRRP